MYIKATDIGVDAGMIMVGDLSYLNDQDKKDADAYQSSKDWRLR